MDFVLSTNPPNPKTSFRLGDWICSSPKCAAHNFGRNLSCIGCGAQRSPSSPTNPTRPAISSPRFTNPAGPSQTPPPPPPNDQNVVLQKPSPHHPLLTPSGRAFAVGGKVQNVSSDPLNPCIMFWPDNEPFPDQGQIRPSGLVGIAQPPILNTGNRGPISHQPGDWICQKCNYLNWRRRKVCQTCLPYAEGNGDSISAAVQAERIALLTNVLARTRLDANGIFQVPVHPTAARPPSFTQQHDSSPPTCALPVQRSHSLTPPADRTALVPEPALLEVSSSLGPPSPNLLRHLAPSPIYQTPLPSSGTPGFGSELISPQHPSSLPQQQHFRNQQQQQQVQMHRNPSPMPMPLLYSTGPATSPFLGIPGHRMRVLSSPAAVATKDWGANPVAKDSVSFTPVPQIVFRARNDSGSSTCSTSSSSSSSSSNAGSILSTPTAGSLGPRSSSSSPTRTTMGSLCPTPPADQALPLISIDACSPDVATSASSLPFMSFGGGGIWKMDGEESRSLKGFYGGHATQRNPHRHHHHHQGFGVGGIVVGEQRASDHGNGRKHHHHGGYEMQAPLPLPVGAGRKIC